MFVVFASYLPRVIFHGCHGIGMRLRSCHNRVELPADAKPGTDFNRWIPKVYNERTLP
eukprot:COSAG01_NODE_66997_length_268_cov_0.887574_1_plen_57_part_10